ncbi:MAG: hypothetical protein HYT62_02320 [Candidatus Yanofskybacteria bacterium]|nr:hypothetical protein [Candidatus Yanofskybacteria bacterium]
MIFINKNQVDGGHLHAWCLYETVSWKHFAYLFWSILACRLFCYKSLTTHLPLELQHNIYAENMKTGTKLINFGQITAAFFRVKLYWENAPLLNYGPFNLKHGQIDWRLVPQNIPLCFDVGHEMLGARSIEEAQKRIIAIFNERSSQIKHLHIHENDLIHDLHSRPDTVITKEMIRYLTQNRTYIFEK